MKCPICGSDLAEYDVFCTHCGAKIERGTNNTNTVNEAINTNSNQVNNTNMGSMYSYNNQSNNVSNGQNFNQQPMQGTVNQQTMNQGFQQPMNQGPMNQQTNSAKVNIKEANSSNYPNLFKKVKIDIYTKSAYDKNNYLFDLQPGITKMRIYMWLEGQDVDSENRASQGDISYKLQFTLNP